MPKIFTTSEAERRAKRSVRFFLIACGLQNPSASESIPNVIYYRDFKDPAKVICDELINRDFANIDSAIHTIRKWMPIYNGERSPKSEDIAKMIVYAAELLGLYWDDTLKTPYETDEFRKTLLGSAVFKYNRLISAIKDKPTKASSSTGGGAQTKTPGQPPQNNYKQSGPQSGNVRDLKDLNGGVGTPGMKVTAKGPYIFRIIGENDQSKNTPNVFIKPLSASGATGSTNKIFFSSGNGYTDCTCWFDDENDAQDFLDKIIANGRVPANVTNPRVVKKAADKNGYFLVGTEFGIVAVSARTLNEALTEAMNNKEDLTGGWEKATASYTKEELEDLHTWMRRD